MRKKILGIVLAALPLVFIPRTASVQQVNSSPDSGLAGEIRTTLARPAAEGLTASELLRYAVPKKLFLRSSVALVMDLDEKVVLFERNTDEKRPIASLTKLMTAMVVLDSGQPLHEKIIIRKADRDRLRGSKSRLSYGTTLTRRDTVYIALAASENRAAHALARTYPGGKKAFVSAMNAKAEKLGMTDTHFQDSSGLHSKNVSTARDLALLVEAAMDYKLIRKFTTIPRGYVTDHRSGWKVEFFNTNRLTRRKDWEIGLSKTGYIADAGNCLVMEAEISDRPLIIVLLNSWGKLSKFGDSNRIRSWLTNAAKRAEEAGRPVKS